MKTLLRISLYGLLAAMGVAILLAAGLWVWTGSDSSLATALTRAGRSLPAGQSLEASGVSGSLRSGGHIGNLRWTRGALQVEASDIQIGWSLRPLWDGELRLGQLTIAQIRIDDRRPVTAPTDTVAPTDLSLPLKVQAAFSVGSVVLTGATAFEANTISGNYQFDSVHHSIHEGKLRISSGDYRVKASVQALLPMATAVQMQGTVDTTVPGSQRKVTVQASAELSGVLGGQDAQLVLKSQISPGTGAGENKALQATLNADIHPWKVQPLARVDAQWQALNLSAIWPQALHTELAGNAHVTPVGGGWQAKLQLRNSASGPWDQQRLPVQSLDADVEYARSQWNLQSLAAVVAGGRVEARGQLVASGTKPSDAQAWLVKATAVEINAAAVDSRLAAVALDGQLTATQGSGGLRFEAQLQPATRQSVSTASSQLRSLRLQTVQAKGLWSAPSLNLEQLLVQTADAKLEGSTKLDTASWATDAHLVLALPGAQASLQGDLSASRGDGKLVVKVSDAARAALWLDQLPGAPVALPSLLRQGQSEFNADWHGGWERQNTLNGLALGLSARVDNGNQKLALAAKLQGGRVKLRDWQASVDAVDLTLQTPTRPGIWNLALTDPVQLHYQQNPLHQTLEISGSGARLSGPAPGTARLQWQAARWDQAQTTPGTPARWRTQGALQDLPLAWLELLGQTQIANLGLKGDLLFGGQWEASGGETLKLSASLQRTSGDLQLQADDTASGPVMVGLRQARLEIRAEGERINAELRWDSERGGKILADFSTRLQQHNGAWTWPADAPVSGTLDATLPPVGAWSMLAPPGWRMRGTLDAKATLSGTAATPIWSGKLQANDLALRSVVDGIDFSQGTLRATLDGQRLEIDEFKLLGAGGASGGQLTVKGSVVWLPASTSANTAAARLRMDLVAQARALRLSTRADRRLVMSGDLTATLAGARLAIGGTLKADQALFILPEDSTPRLGDDVRVRRPTDAPAAPSTAPQNSGARVVPEIAITLDLGSNFEVRGRGLNTHLTGSLALRSNAETQQVPRLTGTLRTDRGSYKAYGQELDVEEGVLRFFGPYDNPSLDILAIRPNLQQRVGVQVSGTALAPVVRLYADPDLPDAEKLAWLVLGRSAANGGAESAMLQQAAMALLGGSGPGFTARLAESLGLDSVSMGSASSTASDGSTTSGATVTLGKRLSRDFYVAYESGMAGTMGTLYIFYDLSRRFTLRAQSGQQSAVDLIFTLRYD